MILVNKHMIVDDDNRLIQSRFLPLITSKYIYIVSIVSNKNQFETLATMMSMSDHNNLHNLLAQCAGIN